MDTIYGDWGTTHLRLWRTGQGAIMASSTEPSIGVLDGMVGARNGLHEVPYVECPVDAAIRPKARLDLVLD